MSGQDRQERSDANDRALIRQMLRMTPTQCLETVAAYWPFVRIDLEHRRRLHAHQQRP